MRIDFVVIAALLSICAYLGFESLSNEWKQAILGKSQPAQDSTSASVPTPQDAWQEAAENYALVAKQIDTANKAYLDQFVSLSRQCLESKLGNQLVDLPDASFRNMYNLKTMDPAAIDAALGKSGTQLAVKAVLSENTHVSTTVHNVSGDLFIGGCANAFSSDQIPFEDLKAIHASAMPILDELVQQNWEITDLTRGSGYAPNIRATLIVQDDPKCEIYVQNMLIESTQEVSFSAANGGLGCDDYRNRRHN